MYEFKVGNYVETKDGKIGHIIGIEDICFTWECTNKPTPIQFCGSRVNYAEKFNRIGKYDFTKKDKIEELKLDFAKVAEPATVTTVDSDGNVTFEFNKMVESYHKKLPTNEQLMNKINEIIKYINKEN